MRRKLQWGERKLRREKKDQDNMASNGNVNDNGK